MPRSKKAITPRSKATQAAKVVTKSQPDDGGNNSTISDTIDENAPVLDVEQRKRKHAKNLALWKEIGYYDIHACHSRLNPLHEDKINFRKKPKDYGSVQEKYNLYVNPSVKHVLLLQYPDREPNQKYCDSIGQKPVEVRIKPKSGIVEVDVPMDTEANFDREKGVDFGCALRKSNFSQRGQSYGLPGGLGIGPNKAVRNDESTLTDGPPREGLLEKFGEANDGGHVMNRITLGGRIIPFRDGDPMYMIATFNGSTCTWTKLNAIVQLRPQFGHIDALNEQEKSHLRSERNTESKAREERAEDVNMVIKDTADNENIDMYGGMNETAKLLRAMRDEPWQRLQWVDQEDTDSHETYQNAMVYRNPDKAKQLVAEMTDTQYLDAFSCPRIDPISQGKKVVRFLGDENNSSDTEDSFSDEDHTEKIAADTDAFNSDESDGGRVYETLPKGVIQPGGIMERDVERICRIICLEAEHRREKLENHLRSSKERRPRFTFLNPSDTFHSYFRWRLRCNELGNGIAPEYDHDNGVDLPKKTGGYNET